MGETGKDESTPAARAAPVRRPGVLGTTRGVRLSASRGRHGAAPAPASALAPAAPAATRYPGESAEPGEVFARRGYSEPND
jgi:hypothetical protein